MGPVLDPIRYPVPVRFDTERPILRTFAPEGVLRNTVLRPDGSPSSSCVYARLPTAGDAPS